MTAGRRSWIAFQRRRASSYVGVVGRDDLAARSAQLVEVVWGECAGRVDHRFPSGQVRFGFGTSMPRLRRAVELPARRLRKVGRVVLFHPEHPGEAERLRGDQPVDRVRRRTGSRGVGTVGLVAARLAAASCCR